MRSGGALTPHSMAYSNLTTSLNIMKISHVVAVKPANTGVSYMTYVVFALLIALDKLSQLST